MMLGFKTTFIGIYYMQRIARSQTHNAYSTQGNSGIEQTVGINE